MKKAVDILGILILAGLVFASGYLTGRGKKSDIFRKGFHRGYEFGVYEKSDTGSFFLKDELNTKSLDPFELRPGDTIIVRSRDRHIFYGKNLYPD